MSKKRMVALIIIGIMIVVLTIGGTYAYFSAVVKGNAENKNAEVSTGTLSLSFADKTGNINIDNMQPGTWWEKRVIVKNTGTIPVNFDLLFLKLNNQIENGELRISIYCTKGVELENNDYSYKNLNDKKYFCNNFSSTYVLNERSIPKQDGENIKLVNNININPQDTYTFYINFLFKETKENQDYNQGKVFNGNIGIKESGTYEINYFNEVIDGNITITNNKNDIISKNLLLYNLMKPNTRYRLSCEIEATDALFNTHSTSANAFSRYGCYVHTIANHNDYWYGDSVKYLNSNNTSANRNASKQRLYSEFTTNEYEISQSTVIMQIIVDGINENVKVGNVILEEID